MNRMLQRIAFITCSFQDHSTPISDRMTSFDYLCDHVIQAMPVSFLLHPISVTPSKKASQSTSTSMVPTLLPMLMMTALEVLGDQVHWPIKLRDKALYALETLIKPLKAEILKNVLPGLTSSLLKCLLANQPHQPRLATLLRVSWSDQTLVHEFSSQFNSVLRFLILHLDQITNKEAQMELLKLAFDNYQPSSLDDAPVTSNTGLCLVLRIQSAIQSESLGKTALPSALISECIQFINNSLMYDEKSAIDWTLLLGAIKMVYDGELNQELKERLFDKCLTHMEQKSNNQEQHSTQLIKQLLEPIPKQIVPIIRHDVNNPTAMIQYLVSMDCTLLPRLMSYSTSNSSAFNFLIKCQIIYSCPIQISKREELCLLLIERHDELQSQGWLSDSLETGVIGNPWNRPSTNDLDELKNDQKSQLFPLTTLATVKCISKLLTDTQLLSNKASFSKALLPLLLGAKCSLHWPALVVAADEALTGLVQAMQKESLDKLVQESMGQLISVLSTHLLYPQLYPMTPALLSKFIIPHLLLDLNLDQHIKITEKDKVIKVVSSGPCHLPASIRFNVVVSMIKAMNEALNPHLPGFTCNVLHSITVCVKELCTVFLQCASPAHHDKERKENQDLEEDPPALAVDKILLDCWDKAVPLGWSDDQLMRTFVMDLVHHIAMHFNPDHQAMLCRLNQTWSSLMASLRHFDPDSQSLMFSAHFVSFGPSFLHDRLLNEWWPVVKKLPKNAVLFKALEAMFKGHGWHQLATTCLNPILGQTINEIFRLLEFYAFAKEDRVEGVKEAALAAFEATNLVWPDYHWFISNKHRVIMS